MADNDRMYHRIGLIGDGNAQLPEISASAHIQPDGSGNWTILENGEVRAIYPTPCDPLVPCLEGGSA